MSILIDKSTRLIVQGITGRDGLFAASPRCAVGFSLDRKSTRLNSSHSH